jgi:hypothetical protein
VDDEQSKETIFGNAPLENPLWSSNVRDLVTSSKVPDHQINKLRAELLVSSSDNDQVIFLKEKLTTIFFNFI